MRASEVGTLIEALRADFKIFGEELTTVKNHVNAIAINQASTLERVTLLEINVRKIQSDIVKIQDDIVIMKTDIAWIKTDHGNRLARLEAVK